MQLHSLREIIYCHKEHGSAEIPSQSSHQGKVRDPTHTPKQKQIINLNV